MRTSRFARRAISIGLALLLGVPSSAGTAGPPSILGSAVALAAPAAPTKCNGQPVVLIDNLPRVKLTIESPVVSNVTNSGCDVSGKLRIQLTTDNNVGNIDISGSVDASNRFYSTNIGYFELLLAGLTFQSSWAQTQPTMRPVFDGEKLQFRAPVLKTPAAWGGIGLPMSKMPYIGSDGLYVDGRFKIPEIVSTIIGISLEAGLAYENGRYKLSAYGEFGIRGLNKQLGASDKGQAGADGCGIKIGATVYYEPSTHAPVMNIRTIKPDEYGPWPGGWQPYPQSTNASASDSQTGAKRVVAKAALPGPSLAPEAPDGLGLEHAVLGLNCSPGIPLHKEMVIFLTGVAGEISLRPDDAFLAFELTFATSQASIGPFTALTMVGRGELGWSPEFRIKVMGTVKVLIFEMASASIEFKVSDGIRAAVRFREPVWLYEGSMHLWGTADRKVHLTGSGSANVGIAKGEIFQSCVPVPYTTWCSGWWGIPYICGGGFNNVCVTVPPSDWFLYGFGAQFGEFRGNAWGFKGYAHVLGYTKGFFGDATNKRLTFGDVDQYVLIDATQVALARQAWLAAQQRQVSSAALDQRLLFQDDGSLIVRASTTTPQNKLGMAPAATTDALTRTNVLTQTDTLFEISSQKPLVMSLIPPAGTPEITPLNYDSPAVAAEYTVSYHEVYTYALQRMITPGSEPRWRYVPASFASQLANVNVKLDGRNVFTNVAVAAIVYTPYVTVTGGVHTVTVVPVGASVPVVTTTLNAQMGSDYSVVAAGTPVASAVVITDNNESNFPIGRGNVRFVNAVSNTAPAIDVVVDGIELFDSIGYKQASAYAPVVAGTHTVAIRNASTNAILQSRTLTVTSGSVLSLVATERLNGTYQAGYADILDEFYKPMTSTQYVVDQATRGEWQVKLTGSVTDTGWTLAVIGAPNPPVVSNVMMDASALDQTQVNVNIQSDYAPTKITFYVTQGEITRTHSFTDGDGVISTTVIPVFEGEAVAEDEISDADELDGSTDLLYELDLTHLETGDYYLWVKVEDGVNSPVMAYAAPMELRRSNPARAARTLRVAKEGFEPLLATQDAEPILVDHTASFPTHFATQPVTPELNIELSTLDETGEVSTTEFVRVLLSWPISEHPDQDGYVVYLDTKPIPANGVLTTTRIITVGESVNQFYDEDGNEEGGLVGILTLQDVYPQTPYYVVVGVIDDQTGMVARSQMATFNVPLGDMGLQGPAADVIVNDAVTFTLGVTMTDDLFYGIELYMDTQGLPAGLDADYLDDASEAAEATRATAREAARAARSPARANWGHVGTIKRAASAQDVYTVDVGVIVSATQGVPRGHYVLPFVAYAGSIERTFNVDVWVMNTVYVPVARRP